MPSDFTSPDLRFSSYKKSRKIVELRKISELNFRDFIWRNFHLEIILGKLAPEDTIKINANNKSEKLNIRILSIRKITKLPSFYKLISQ